MQNRNHWSHADYRRAVFAGIVFLAGSLLANHIANDYIDVQAGAYVPDLILNVVPVLPVGGILNYGTMLAFILLVAFVAREPQRLPFVLKGTALFILIRSLFITMTHLGPAPQITPMNPDSILSQLLIGKDYFFSGHTGLPFFMALVFWQNKLVRTVSLFFSVMLGISVLLGHLHYSIDVFSAYFIAYSIFHMAQKLFPREYQLNQQG